MNRDMRKKNVLAREAAKIKKAVPAKVPKPSPAPSSTDPDPKHQQQLLNVFSDAFSHVLSSDGFSGILQEIKQALFNREFAKAFGSEDYLEAYAARWSPTRALCYATVFESLKDYLNQVALPVDVESLASVTEPVATKPATTEPATAEEENSGTAEDPSQTKNETPNSSLSKYPDSGKKINMLAIGGCAAEHVAFASYLDDTSSHGTLTLLDSAPWSQVTSLLQTQLITPPTLSKYASAAVKASNKAILTPAQLSIGFVQHDVFALEKEKLQELVGTKPLVVTLLFTLNELYTTRGIGPTTKFLKSLGDVLPSGSMLLVVDSPGSYSEATVGKEKKRYPMHWLLNHTLETEAKGFSWEKLESQDSVWFRLPEVLSYPIPLENMRYQVHLYKIEKT